MTSLTTTYLPLTTTFTAPVECFSTPYIVHASTEWFLQGNQNATCFPSAFPSTNANARNVYSPGICPAGWTSACHTLITTGSSTKDIVNCCPSSMGCVSWNSLRDWEATFGCVSPYSVNLTAWSTIMRTTAPCISSMYQRQVMIVTAPTTTVSSTSQSASSTSSSPTSTMASNAIASATNSVVATSSGGLSSGAIAGISVGVIVGVAVIALLAYIAWIVKKKRSQNAIPESTAQPSGYAPAPEYKGYASNSTYAAHHQYNVEPMEIDGTPKTPGHR